ncbi:hypothetical protein JMG10_02105 [Nostoc ellipsosporum NOK]|jgi:hypothetical protein|nr:hypothetical protein [Nostoc ellipsosporum NOK]
MKKQMMKIAFAAFATALVITSCKKDKGETETNDEEVITTMKLTFVPVGGGTTLTYQFQDPDGPGGVAPTQDEIVLAPSKTYNVSVQLLNVTANPVDDITAEIQAEKDAHRFYYIPGTGSNITVSGLDNDSNGVPVGLTSTWTTGAAANGTIRVVLRHYPGNPPGKATTDAVDSPKSGTDIEVNFVTKIQ